MLRGGWTGGWSVGWSVGRLLNFAGWVFEQAGGWLVRGWMIGRSVGRSVGEPDSRLVGRSVELLAGCFSGWVDGTLRSA
eukprot:362011-Chlamydomonas_euryale.AAC.5